MIHKKIFLCHKSLYYSIVSLDHFCINRFILSQDIISLLYLIYWMNKSYEILLYSLFSWVLEYKIQWKVQSTFKQTASLKDESELKRLPVQLSPIAFERSQRHAFVCLHFMEPRPFSALIILTQRECNPSLSPPFSISSSQDELENNQC